MLGIVAVMDGLGRIALGVGNITDGFTGQAPIPSNYIEVAATTTAQLTDIDNPTAMNISNIANYALGLIAPGADATTILGAVNNILTANDALHDIQAVLQSLGIIEE